MAEPEPTQDETVNTSSVEEVKSADDVPEPSDRRDSISEMEYDTRELKDITGQAVEDETDDMNISALARQTSEEIQRELIKMSSLKNVSKSIQAHEMKNKRLNLGIQLFRRPSLKDLAQKHILFDDKMAGALHGSAQKLDARLKRRPSVEHDTIRRVLQSRQDRAHYIATSTQQLQSQLARRRSIDQLENLNIFRSIAALTQLEEQRKQAKEVLADALANRPGYQEILRNIAHFEDDGQNMFQIGDRIETVDGKTGVVRYVGPVGNSDTIMIGLELDKPVPSGHTGKGYFQTERGRGYFAPLEAINAASRNDYLNDSDDEDEKNTIPVTRDAYKDRRARVKYLKEQLRVIDGLEQKSQLGADLTMDEQILRDQREHIEQELDKLTKRRLSLKLESELLSRPSPMELMNAHILHSSPVDMAPAIQGKALELQTRLRRRPSFDILMESRILPAHAGSQSRRIQPTAYELEKKLLSRSLNSPYVKSPDKINSEQTERRQRRASLSHLLGNRPPPEDLERLGVVAAANWDAQNHVPVSQQRYQQNVDALAHVLAARPPLQQLIDAGILTAADIAPYTSRAAHVQSYIDQQRLQALGARLNRRPSLTDVYNLGYLRDETYLPHSNIDQLEKFLRERPDLDYLRRKHIIQHTSNLASSLQGISNQLQRRRLSHSLNDQLLSRSTREELTERRILYDPQTAMSGPLVPTASAVDNKLKRRPSIEDVGKMFQYSHRSAAETTATRESVQQELSAKLNRRPSRAELVKSNIIHHESLLEYDITITSRPCGIRFKTTNDSDLVVDQVRPESRVQFLGVQPDDLVVAINGFGLESIAGDKSLEIFRTSPLPMHVRFRRRELRKEPAVASMGIESDDPTVQSLLSQMQQWQMTMESLHSEVFSLKARVGMLEQENMQLKQENLQFAAANEDFVDRMLVVDHECEQMKVQILQLEGEYELVVASRPVGIQFVHTHNRTQLRVHHVTDTSYGELFNVQPGDVLISINNHDVSGINSERVLTWFRNCPLPMHVKFRKESSELELEKARFQLEQQRQHLLARLAHDELANVYSPKSLGS